MPRVSIVIPHYNGKDILRDCLESLYRGVFLDFELILVDNAGTDGSVDMVRESFPQVRILQMEKNLGFAGGCNAGIREAGGEYICILNNDTLHDRDWLAILVEHLDSHPETASVQPLILSYHNRDAFDYSGGSGGFIDRYGYPFVRGRLFEVLEKNTGQYDDVRQIFWASGTAFLVRSAVLSEIGLFDEDFFAHMEEIDLHWRMHLAGCRVDIVPRSRIRHLSGWTLPPDRYLKKYLNHRNNLLMIFANYSAGSLIRIFPVRLFLEYVSALYALLKGDWKRFGAVFASQFYFFTHLPSVLRKHRRHQTLRKKSDAEITGAVMYPKALVIQHYLKAVRRFSDLKF